MRERPRKSPLPGATDKGQTFADDISRVADQAKLATQNRWPGRLGGGSWSSAAASYYRSNRFLDADLRASRFRPGPRFAWADAPAVVAALQAFRANQIRESA